MTAFELAQQVAENGPEISAFRCIDGWGGVIWRLNHDMADGRIPESEWPGLDASIKDMQEAQKIIIDSLTKYDLSAPLMVEGKLTLEYWKWYRWWKNYIDGMPNDEYDRLCMAEEAKADLSGWRPQGTWKEQQT